MEAHFSVPADTVRRPGVLEVGLCGEVAARVDMVVTGGDHMAVSGLGLTDQVGDGGGDIRAPVTARLPPSQKSF